jgi:hypothetical protein
MKENNILLIIFLVTVIPVITVYYIHALEEINELDNTKSKIKKTKILSEAILFMGIGFGYTIMTCWLLMQPKNKIPYLVILVGTVGVIILYYMRIYGIQIPNTNIVITDFSSDWRDVVTKICQQILVIPIAILYGRMFYKKTEVN